MSNVYNSKLQSQSALEQAVMEATGPIEFNMTNDYMFRAVLQSNEKVLRGLVCSLLHFTPDEIKAIEIKNPIQLGKKLNSKDFVLDIRVMLNNHTIINLEMQVRNYQNWPERSLSYLCRSFDNLNKGKQYLEVKPAIHIGILDFDPFPDYPEFYASYRMINEKTHHLYSDKFTLRVLLLKQIKLATDEDKKWRIDHWAHLFKVKTWEELKMLVEENADFMELSKEMYKQNADETILDQCRAREENERWERDRNQKMAELQAEIEELNSQNNILNSENEALSSKNEALNAEIAQLKKQLAGMK